VSVAGDAAERFEIGSITKVVTGLLLTVIVRDQL
jgi:CubicO group peptidase (beta-lactamase class C family)